MILMSAGMGARFAQTASDFTRKKFATWVPIPSKISQTGKWRPPVDVPVSNLAENKEIPGR